MKIDPADAIFSRYIRLRDGRCVRCQSPVRLNDQGLPSTHHNSHYFGRTRESTRFDPLNCDTLCHGCHRFWEKEDREGYRNFKVTQLGQDGFDALVVRANLIGKKDRKLALLQAKAMLDSLV